MAKTETDKIKISNLSDVKFSVGKDRRGYKFYGKLIVNSFYVYAGCHKFLMENAYKHWTDPKYIENSAGLYGWSGFYHEERLRAMARLPHIIRMLNAIEAEAVKRGWLVKGDK